MSDLYNDTIIIQWRSGLETDPYVNITDTAEIINGKVILTEVPDPFRRVEVPGYIEIEEGLPSDSEFVVNYQNGIVTFNPSQNGKQVTLKYSGRGVILYPASRIYAHGKNPNAVESLQEILDKGQQAIEIIDVLDSKVEEADNIIKSTSEAASNARNAADLANIATNNANEATSKANQATINANDATNKANIAANEANNATSLVLSVINDANQAIKSANEATNRANIAVDNTEDVITDANIAIESANQATTNAQNIANNLRYFGKWNSETEYKINNMVEYQGSLYIAIQNNKNIEPTIQTHWALAARSGIDGQGTIRAITSANADIRVNVEDPENPVLSINAGDGPNQIAKRDEQGNLHGTIDNALTLIGKTYAEIMAKAQLDAEARWEAEPTVAIFGGDYPRYIDGGIMVEEGTVNLLKTAANPAPETVDVERNKKYILSLYGNNPTVVIKHVDYASGDKLLVSKIYELE